MIMSERDLDRFMSKVFYDTNGLGCWLFDSAPQTGDYSTFSIKGVSMGAHIASYRKFVGPIPAGYQVDHACRVPCCANPHHLEAVTPKENRRRTIPFRPKTHRKPIRSLDVYDFNQPPGSFRELIAKLGGCVEVSRQCGLPLPRVQKMNGRNSIGADNWEAILELAAKKGFPEIDLGLLCRLCAIRGKTAHRTL